MTNNKHILIGISGKANSGKNTVASIINDLTNNRFEEKCFAGKLKDMVCLLIGCTRSDLEDRDFKERELGEEWWYYSFKPVMLDYLSHRDNTIENGIDKNEKYIIKLTPRKLMTLLGTECGRALLHPNIWVNSLFGDYLERIDMTPAPHRSSGINVQSLGYPSWIVTDIRFPNEVEAIKSRGGIVIRVNRPDEVTLGGGDNLYEHPSETLLDGYQDFDYIIENDGDISDLVRKVKELGIV